MKKINIDIDNLIRLYELGESEKALAEKFGVSRTVIRPRLIENGIKPRNRSEAMYVRMSRTSKEERARLTAASHAAIRGTHHSFERQCKTAISRERSQSWIGRGERICLDMLRTHGLDGVPQKAIGPYNVDIAIDSPSIAVEIFGGHWHTCDEHASRFRKRTDYILNAGWAVIIIWVTRNYPLERGAIEYIVALSKKLSGGKPMRRQEHVIRGDGKFTAVGERKLNGLPPIHGPQPTDNITGRFISRPRE